MTEESTGTEKRQLGLKISEEAYAALARRAKARGMSPTTLARWLLLDQIGFEEEVVIRNARRRGVLKPVRAEIKAALELLRELQLIRVRLDGLGRPVKGRKSAVAYADAETIQATLEDARELFQRVLTSMSGGKS